VSQGLSNVVSVDRDLVSTGYGVGLHRVNDQGRAGSYRIRAINSSNNCFTSKSEFSEKFNVIGSLRIADCEKGEYVK